MKTLMSCVRLAVLALMTCPAAAIAAYTPPAPKPTGEPIIQILKYHGTGEQGQGNRKHVYVTLSPLNGTRLVQIFVPPKDQNHPEPDPAITGMINGLKPGDVVKAEIQQMNGMPSLKSIMAIEVKPGEENPHGYVYSESYPDDKTGATVVKLTKYGQDVELLAARVRGEKGKMETDPQVTAAIQSLKSGDVVYVQMAQGRTPVLTGIFPYKEPETGKVTRVSEQEVDGKKMPAIELQTADGKSVTAIIPGKLSGKRWVADPNMLRLARSMRPGTEVQFLTHDDENQKTYLVDISKAPPAPKPEKSMSHSK
jgi:hypothetical protein